MTEVALVFAADGSTIAWHTPPGATGASIPDDRGLWEILWEHRERLGGVAHTHPGRGQVSPSHEDVTTWAAVERGLGKRLLWPVMNFDEVRYYGWNPVTNGYYEVDERWVDTPEGLVALWNRSYRDDSDLSGRDNRS